MKGQWSEQGVNLLLIEAHVYADPPHHMIRDLTSKMEPFYDFFTST